MYTITKISFAVKHFYFFIILNRKLLKWMFKELNLSEGMQTKLHFEIFNVIVPNFSEKISLTSFWGNSFQNSFQLRSMSLHSQNSLTRYISLHWLSFHIFENLYETVRWKTIGVDVFRKTLNNCESYDIKYFRDETCISSLVVAAKVS